MYSRPSTSNQERAGRSHRAGQRKSRPFMSEKQIEAYFVARDTLRRVQRISSILATPNGTGSELAHLSDSYRTGQSRGS